MSIYRRGKSWYINVTLGGRRIACKAGNTQEEAAALVESLKANFRLSKIQQRLTKINSELIPTHNKLQEIAMKKPMTIAHSPKKISEKFLENYLEKNLSNLESGLQFVSRQKFISTGRVDIVARDIEGSNIFIELKTDTSDKLGIDKLCGQVSRYFNRLKRDKTKMYLVIPIASNNRLQKIYDCLQHWIEIEQVRIYQFDYMIYSKQFIFSEVDFTKLNPTETLL